MTKVWGDISQANFADSPISPNLYTYHFKTQISPPFYYRDIIGQSICACIVWPTVYQPAFPEAAF